MNHLGAAVRWPDSGHLAWVRPNPGNTPYAVRIRLSDNEIRTGIHAAARSVPDPTLGSPITWMT